ncbi:SEL1-like repeat protein [Streptomyces xanthophaeus]
MNHSDHLDHFKNREFFSGRAEKQGRVFQQQSGVQINADSLILTNLAETARLLPPAPFTAPPVAEVSASELGVHHAGASTQGDLPPYVERQIDIELRTKIKNIPITGEAILIVGDSTAGKTRAAFEALKECFTDRRIFAPIDGPDLCATLPGLIESKGSCVLWLDNLERYIGPDGLTPQVVSLLRRNRIPVLSTMRAEQYRQFIPSIAPIGSVNSDERINLGRRILEQIHASVLPRLWNSEEIERARKIDDSRILGAVAFSTHYGVAEYLAAGPRLYQEWILAWGPGMNPRGAALVAAAVDCVRAGITQAVTRELLEQMHETYLSRVGGAILRPEAIDDAFEWATCLRFGVTSLLLPAEQSGKFRIFDYIPDEFMRSNAMQPIPKTSWRSILEFSKRERSTYLVGLAASGQGETEIAEEAWKESAHRGSGKALLLLGNLYINTDRDAEAIESWGKAAEAGEGSAYASLGIWYQKQNDTAKALELFRKGAEMDDAVSTFGLAEVLGTTEEAEQWWIKLAEMNSSGADLHNLARYYESNDRMELARNNYKAAAEHGYVPSMNNFGAIIADENPEEGERWFRAAREGGSLQAATNLAMLLLDRGQKEAAQDLLREAIEAGYLEATATLGWLLEQQGSVSQAMEIWEQGAQGGVEWSIYNLAICCTNEGNPAKAIELYRKIADFNNEAAENLGFALISTGDADEGLKILSRVKEQVSPQSSCAIGSALLHSGRKNEATSWYGAALEAGHGHAGCWLGEISWQEGRYDEAAGFYRASFNGGHLHAASRISQMMLALGRGHDAAHWLRLSRGLPPQLANRSSPSRKRRGKKKGK